MFTNLNSITEFINKYIFEIKNIMVIKPDWFSWSLEFSQKMQLFDFWLFCSKITGKDAIFKIFLCHNLQQKYSQKIQLFGSMDPLPANTYNEIFKVTDIDVDGRTKILALIRTELVTVIHEYVRFTHGIPAFKKLLPGDQASLLKGLF